jgi:alkylated DNA repair dioxygenase AlkB
MTPLVHYFPQFVKGSQRQAILQYLQSLYPLWEQRFSASNPPPTGEPNRFLLRPVYWLGNWQFACLDYYHPPKGLLNRCVQAEEFPSCLQQIVDQAEQLVHQKYQPRDIPKGWHLNTCLINYYGDRNENGKHIDCARVGEHKDFEPGPVVSLSFGDRALFQFVQSRSKQSQSQVVLQQWLEDGSLQIFGGDRFKKQLFHRVQRVEKKTGLSMDFHTENFQTRRLNLTFRFVPTEHVQPYQKLPTHLQADIQPYMEKLAQHSSFFRQELELV